MEDVLLSRSDEVGTLRYSAIACGVSWIVWLPLVLRAHGSSQYLHFAGSLGPAVAAFACAWIDGRSSVTLLLSRFLRWRLGVRWFVVAAGGPLLLLCIAYPIAQLAGSGANGLAIGRSDEYPQLGVIAYLISSIFFYGIGEETGWRGYLLPQLQRHMSALRASLIVAMLWSFWHLPLFAFAPGLSHMRGLAVFGWLFSMLTGSLLFTWLFNSSGGSVPIVALFHGMMDVVFLAKGPPLLTNILGALVTLVGIAAAFRLSSGETRRSLY